MPSLRDPSRRYLPAVRTPLEAAYWGGAVVSGAIIGLQLLPWPIDIVVLLGIGIAVTAIGWRVEGGIDQHRPTAWLWVLIGAIVWLPLALVTHHFPFAR
jgi:hypothetical protein